MEEMGQTLLLLHHQYDVDSQVIWRAAIARGWRTERIGPSRIDIERKILGYKHVRYYGNTLHHEECHKYLPLKCTPIDLTNLANLEEFTKRKIELVRAETISNPVNHDIFLKCPGTKWIQSKIYRAGDTFGPIKPDDLLYAQSILSGIKTEIRTFVIDGEIQTASYYYNLDHKFQPKEIIDVPEEIREMARQIYQKHKWPRGIVFDFGTLENGEYFFIEANEAWCSGLYHCDPNKCLDTIIASQE